MTTHSIDDSVSIAHRPNHRPWPLVALFGLTSLVSDTALAAPDLCFADRAHLRCSDSAGQSVESVARAGHPREFAIDEAHQETYAIATERTIDRIDADGRIEEVYEGQDFISSIDVDEIRGFIYWSESDPNDPSARAIYRAPRDFRYTQKLPLTLKGLRSFIVDEFNARLFIADADGYWCSGPNCSAPGTLIRATLDGRWQTTIAQVDNPGHIAVDPTGCTLYWTEGTRVADIYTKGCWSGTPSLLSPGGFLQTPSSLDWDAHAQRLLVSQRGDVLTVDPNSGQREFFFDAIEGFGRGGINEVVSTTDGRIYYHENGSARIFSVATEGYGTEQLTRYPWTDNLRAVAYDRHRHLYYVADYYEVFQVRMDGKEPETLSHHFAGVDALTVDPKGEALWVGFDRDRPIVRMSLDHNLWAEFDPGLPTDFVDSIAFIDNDIYWSRKGSIYAASQTGENARLVSTPAAGAHGVAIDATSRRLYYIAELGVMRANLDGSNASVVLDAGVPLTTIDSFSLSLPEGRIYLVDRSEDTMMRANLDGTGAESIFAQDSTVTDIEALGLNQSCGNVHRNTENSSVSASGGSCRFADISGASGSYVSLSGADLRNALLDEVDFRYSWLSNGDFEDARFRRAKLYGAWLTSANFSGADMYRADLSETVGNHTNFSEANLMHADFSGTFLKSPNFTNAELWGANFEGAVLQNAIWLNTECPDGTDSDAHGGTCEGHF